jgi:Fe-Mn family superoxide dismutase
MYTPKTFNIPEIAGISSTNIEEHLKLYQGYVNSLNTIEQKLQTLPKDETYTRSELTRRFSFEFGGMRNHEIYFSSLEGGSSNLPVDSRLFHDIVRDFGGTDEFVERIKEIALMRGIGFAMLSFDISNYTLILSWVDEQHIGQIPGAMPIYAIDMWEHAYVGDYWSSGKKKYIQDYINATNFVKVAENYEKLLANLKPL